MNEKSNHWISMTKIDPIRTGQPYARSAGTSIGTDLARDENGLLRVKLMLIQ